MRTTKTMRYVADAGKAVILAGIPILATPSMALAGWTDDTLNSAAQRVGQTDAKEAGGGSIIEALSTLTNWLLGISLVLFVLKVVLTAVDRILVDYEKNSAYQAGGESSLLVSIPIVGAYPPPDQYSDGGDTGYSWKRIWINFATQLIIAVAAWFFVRMIFGALLAVFGSLTGDGAGTGTNTAGPGPTPTTT